MSNPRVSVIIPLYNQKHYVAESIASVLKQTMTDFELIIVDDASDDGSLEIAEFYAKIDNRIQIHTLDENVGQAAATNHGLTFAKGEYIAWHHSDDNYHPEFLEKLLATKADVAYSALAYISTDSGWSRCVNDLDNFVFDLEELRRKNYLCSGAMIYKRSISEELGGYDASFQTCTDWDFSIRACELAGTVGLVPEVLIYYRDVHVNSNRVRISDSIRTEERYRIRKMHGSDTTDIEAAMRAARIRAERKKEE